MWHSHAVGGHPIKRWLPLRWNTDPELTEPSHTLYEAAANCTLPYGATVHSRHGLDAIRSREAHSRTAAW